MLKSYNPGFGKVRTVKNVASPDRVGVRPGVHLFTILLFQSLDYFFISKMKGLDQTSSPASVLQMGHSMVL